MVVYVENIFFLNAALCFSVLLSVGLLRRCLFPWRMLAASLLAGAASVPAALLPSPLYRLFPLALLPVVLLAAFGSLRHIGLYCLLSILLCGAFGCLQTESSLWLCLCAAVLPMFVLFGRIIPVTVKTSRGTAILTALSDTGNLLSSGGVPVVLINRSAACRLAPLSALCALGLSHETDEEPLYPLPCRTVCGKSVLYCFRPKSLRIGLRRVQCLVAPSLTEDFSGFEAIVNPAAE